MNDPTDPPTFDAIALSPELRRAIDEMGFSTPTSVQVACFAKVVAGSNVVVQSRTGSGKTLAFGMPILERLQPNQCALILCPTRELAVQVGTEIGRLAKYKPTPVSIVYGGVSFEKQVTQLQTAQVIAGTPGRVLDHIRRGTMDAKKVRILVLDEADEMLSMGFERELRAIMESISNVRQTLLFSATVSNDVERLVSQLRDPERILLSEDRIDPTGLVHYFYLQTGNRMFDLLRVLEVEQPPSGLIFCNTKDDTERTARELQNAGYEADYISGDLDQGNRERVLARLRDRKLRFLVATDVAARGIDISHLSHVINFDFPENPEQYVHRTGRTARAGNSGTAISLISPKDVGNLYYLRLTYGLRPIERSIPSLAEISARREIDILAKLEAEIDSSELAAQTLSLARRLATHDRSVRIIAHLLGKQFPRF